MKTVTVTFTEKEKVGYIESEVPELRENEILIKTARTLISTGTEISVFAGRHTNALLGMKGAWGTFPFQSGYINAGKVMETGSSVKEIQKGDRVLSICCNTTIAKAPVDQVIKIPDNVTDEEALFTIIANIVFPAIRQSTISLGDNAVVVGLGLLGQFALQFLRLNGAIPALGVDISDYRLNLAAKMGATTLINSAKTDMLKEVKNLTGGRGADVVIELTGVPKLFSSVCALARAGGKVILLSSPHGSAELDLYTDIHKRSLNVIGVGSGLSVPKVEEFYSRWTIGNTKNFILKLIGDKTLRVNEMISHRYHWENAHEAYAMLLKDRGSAMGVILEWES